jgi:hypothetical protein
MARYKLERAISIWVAVAVVAVIQSCDSLVGRSCTLRPCVGGLVVEVTGDVSQEPLNIEATTPGGTQLTEPCHLLGEHCLAIFDADFTPEQATIRIMGASDTTVHVVHPEYTVSYPNGTDCGPVCRSATVGIER